MDRVAGFVGSVQLRLKIDQATSNTDDPAPSRNKHWPIFLF